MNAFSATSAHWRKAVSTPTILQMEAAECGVAALSMILGHFRRFVSLQELRQTCGVSRDGTRASALIRAAKDYGLEAKGLQLPIGRIEEAELPFIAFWGNNHFVVVDGPVGRGIRINDPALGRCTLSREEFAELYSGVAITFKPGPEFVTGGHRQGLLRTLFEWTTDSKGALLVMTATTLLMALPSVMMPALVKAFVDEVLIRRFDTWMFPLVVSLMLTIVIGGAITWLQQRTLMRLQMKLAVVIGSRFLWHILRLPLLFFTQRQNGDIVSRVQSAHSLAALLAGPLPTAVAQLGMIVLYAGVMVVYSLPLTIVAIVLSAGSIVAAGLMRRRLKDGSAALLTTKAKIAATAMGGLQSIETVKAMSSEADFFRVWSGYQARNVNQFQALGHASILLGAVPAFLGQVVTGAVLCYGAILIMDGQLSMGGLIAFQMLLGNFTAPLQQVVGLSAQLQEAKSHLARLEDVFSANIDPLVEERSAPADAVLKNLSGAIELRDVGFAYAPFDPPVLHGISLKIEPGQRIALVGGSGSGKTTLVKLLLGLFSPSSGTIHYDDRAIADVPRDVFTASLAWVDQDIRLFAGTIQDNLTLSNRATTATVIAQAARDAHIHETILARPGGYSGPVTEGGTNFSGGQRQRLEIARALAREPSILILDEATAALDPITEVAIDGDIRRRGLTCVIVAQRLSTIRDCDQIFVLQGGGIVERGNHHALMAANGVYAALVQAE